MRRLLSVLIVVASGAFPQKSELGAVGGFGAIAAGGLSTTGAVAFGAEFCGLCSGKFGLFGEWNHLESVGKARTRGINRFDIVAGGLRIQGGGRVRPFFDTGVAYGVDSFSYSGGHNSHGNGGLVLAGGAAVRLQDRLYIRPQFRFYALRGLHAVAAGTTGIGVQF
jgi:hypothetical protein